MKKVWKSVFCLLIVLGLMFSVGTFGVSAAAIEGTTYLGLYNAYAGNKTADAEVYSFNEDIIVADVEWRDSDGNLADTFIMGEYYDVTVTLEPTSGSYFDVDDIMFGVAFDGKIAYFNEDKSNFTKNRVVASYTMKYSMEYVDVLKYKDPWYYKDVLYISQRGIMYGTGNGYFSPDATTTRAMVVTVLYRMAGSPDLSDENTAFTDLKAGGWYEKAVMWAEDNNIAAGISDTTFSPDMNVTREQFITFLYRYSKEWLDLPVEDDAMVITGFADVNSVHSYAYDSFSWGTGSKIVQGSRLPDGGVYLQPQGEATRAQVAAFIHRFCEKYNQ